MKLQISLALAALAIGMPLTPRLTTAQAADEGQWTMPGKNYSATRFSKLDKITTENVGHLRNVWNFSTGVLSGHEGQPLVVNNTMYVVTPYPDVLYAFDLTKPDNPLKWKYRPAVDPAAIGIACCDVINRGATSRYDPSCGMIGRASQRSAAITTSWSLPSA